MNFKLIKYLTVITLFFTILAPSHAAAESRLSTSQIKALFPGHFSGTIKGKYDFALTGHTNGKLVGSGWGITGEGRWSIEKNKFCMHFWVLKKGKKCRTLYRTSKNNYIGRRDDGKSWIVFKRMPLPRKIHSSTQPPFSENN